VDKQVFGYANVQLALLYSSSLFWWRECIRKALAVDPRREIVRKYLPIQVIFPIVVCVLTQLTMNGDTEIKYLRETILLVSISAIFESPAEYFYCDALISNSMQTRVVAEGVALAVKSASIYGALLAGFNLAAYGVGHVCYSVTLLVTYKL